VAARIAVALADLPFTEIARNGVDRQQISRELTSIYQVLLANVVGERNEIVAHRRNRLMEEVNRMVSDPVARALVADPLGMG
jgi:hypothetical protein